MLVWISRAANPPQSGGRLLVYAVLRSDSTPNPTATESVVKASEALRGPLLRLQILILASIGGRERRKIATLVNLLTPLSVVNSMLSHHGAVGKVRRSSRA